MTPPRGSRSSTSTVGFRQVEVHQLILLKGSEHYLATRAIDRIKAQLRAKHSEVEYTRLDVSSASPGELNTLASPSLFGEPRLILAEDLKEMNETFLTEALQMVQAPPGDDVTLVLRHSGGNRGKKLLDLVAQRGVVVDCAPVKSDAQKLDFVRGEFREQQRTILPDAARSLIAAAGSTLSDLGGACRQLMSDISGDITVEHVDQYFGGRVEATAFKVADAAFEGRGESAIRLFRHAMATGVAEVNVTAALAYKARQIAALADYRGSQGSLASALGISPYQLKFAADTARRFSPRAAAAAIEIIAQADAEAKGASRTPEYAVERAISAIASGMG